MTRVEHSRNKKTHLIPIIAAILFVSFAPYTCLAYSGGSGTSGNPYRIGTSADLLALAANTDDYDKNFVLTKDIDLSSSGTFTTAVIARDTNNANDNFDGAAFTGSFDGAGHKIVNLTIDTGGIGNDCLALFGCFSGNIKNLGLENATVTGGDYSYWIGGLVGANYGGNISNCYLTGAVASGIYPNFLGGLVGWNDGSISNCYSTGTVTGGYASYMIGGLVGENENGTISNCYATGTVTGGVYSYFLGGLAGYNWTGNISNSYSTGVVSGGDYSDYIGGFLGYRRYGTVSNCYFLTTSGTSNRPGMTPLTDEQMKQQASYAGWDFVGETVNGTEDIWLITEGVYYPKLAWQSILPTVPFFGSVNGQKNVKLTLQDCFGNDVTFSLIGGGFGEVNAADCNFSTITLYDTTDKSTLIVASKGQSGIGSIICNGSLKSINGRTIDVTGNIEIGSSLNPKASVTIAFDEASDLTINSEMPIKSIAATEWLGGSINAPSVGSIKIKGDKKRSILGDLDVDVTLNGSMNSVKVAGTLSGDWACNAIKSISATDIVEAILILNQQPDAKMLALGKLAAKGWIDSSRILSQGNIGTVTAGGMFKSCCFTGIAAVSDVNVPDGVLDLPGAEASNFDESAMIKKITVKGIKTEQAPYYINSNIAAANILSVYLAYPEYDNDDVVFGIAADYIKALKIKDAAGTISGKNLDKQIDAPDLPGNAEILLYEP